MSYLSLWSAKRLREDSRIYSPKELNAPQRRTRLKREITEVTEPRTIRKAARERALNQK